MSWILDKAERPTLDVMQRSAGNGIVLTMEEQSDVSAAALFY
ncbi:hypothetical protein [Bradyrhizobium sp. NFR13]|jgi:hypothetical protein|nr:hypothetical protein [Bradyrhizobium sp. NFR13]